MSNVKSQISSLAERTESNGTAVARIASNLDMEVKARQNIEEQLQKIKNDLKEEYQGIKYILTSTMRTKLLLSIYNESKNLDDLRIELENKYRCSVI